MPVEFEVEAGELSAEDIRVDAESWQLAMVSLVRQMLFNKLSMGEVQALVFQVPTDLERTVGCNGNINAESLSWRAAEEMLGAVKKTVAWRRLIKRQARSAEALEEAVENGRAEARNVEV
jgi:hypothetical protein